MGIPPEYCYPPGHKCPAVWWFGKLPARQFFTTSNGKWRSGQIAVKKIRLLDVRDGYRIAAMPDGSWGGFTVESRKLAQAGEYAL
jgi:hypothetical protein